ncbi:MAG: ABC transporter substrate-binding protein [Desulfobacterales bacterium]
MDEENDPRRSGNPTAPRCESRRLSIRLTTALGFCAAAVLVLLYSGCADREERLTFWVGGAPQEVDYWEELVAGFERESGIEVEVVRQPTATDQRKQGLVMALASGRPDPDVFLMDIIWIPHFIRSEWLEPLDPYFHERTLMPEFFFSTVVEDVDRHDDRYYALPAFLDIGILYYRKDLLERYGFDGPPETWRELVRQSVTIQEAERRQNPGFTGFVWQGAQYEGLVCTFLEFAATHGGGIVADGRIDLNRRGNLAALQFMQDLIRRWRISPPNTYTEMREEQVRRTFQRGNALFERNWLYAWGLHERPGSAVRGKVGMTSLPHAPDAKPGAALGGWHLGISKTADAKDRAWRLASYLLSRETQKKLLLRLGWYSGRKDVYTDPEVLRTVPHIDRLRRNVAHAVSRPASPYYDLVSRIIQRYVNDCLAGKQEASQALEAMQREIDRIGAYYDDS